MYLCIVVVVVVVVMCPPHMHVLIVHICECIIGTQTHFEEQRISLMIGAP